MSRSNHWRSSIKNFFLKSDEMGLDIIMFYIYSFHFGIIIFAFYPRSSRPEVFLNHNKAGLSEDSFFLGGGGGQFEPPPPSYFRKNLSNINITLYN